MDLNRRDFLRFGSAAGASLVLPRVVRATRRKSRLVKPRYLLSGGASPDGILVNSTLSPIDTYTQLDLAVSESAQLGGYTLMGLQQSDDDAIVRHLVTGRRADTVYYARLVSNDVPVGETIRFKTMPTGLASWSRKIAVVSCMGNASDKFSTEHAWEDVIAWAPDDIWHLGDWGYWGQLIPATGSYKKDLYHYMRSMRNLPTMRAAIQSAGLNVVMISDHELTVNGDPVEGMHDSPESIRELVAFQKLMPVRAYGDTRAPRRGRYYFYDIGQQVRVIVTDFRSPDRSNNTDKDQAGKTMFGETQLDWIYATLDSSKVNLLVNETSWLGDPTQVGRAHDKPWFYNYEQNQIVDYIADGGYQVAWIGGDRHYVGYLAGSGSVYNTLGNFPCYIGSGMGKDSNELERGELMTWVFGAHPNPETHVCQYMQLTVSYDAVSNQVTVRGKGRAVLDTTMPVSDWVVEDIPGGLAHDTWSVGG